MNSLREERAKMRAELACTVRSELNLPSKLLANKRTPPKPNLQRGLDVFHAPSCCEKLLGRFPFIPTQPSASSPIAQEAQPGGVILSPLIPQTQAKVEPMKIAGAQVLVKGKLEAVYAGVNIGNAERHPPAWHRVTEEHTERLSDGVSKMIEDAYSSGKTQVVLPDKSGGEVLWFESMTTQLGATLVRDEFSFVDFYGKRFRTKQEELDQRRQETIQRRKEMVSRTPPHCHIYHHPVIAELQQAGQFPLAEVRTAGRNKAGFVAGSKTHLTHDVAPSLEEALPQCNTLPRKFLGSTMGSSAKLSISGKERRVTTVGCVLRAQSVQSDSSDKVFEKPTTFLEEDEETTHLLANNFAAIRNIINNIPQNKLPKLDIPHIPGPYDDEGISFSPPTTPKGTHTSLLSEGQSTANGVLPLVPDPAVHLRDPNCTACKVYMNRQEGNASNSFKSSDQEAKSQEWRNISYSNKLHLSNVLKYTITRRQVTKEYVTKSPAFLAELARLAELQAKRWIAARYGGAPLKSIDKVTPPSIWENGSNRLCLERADTFQCIICYSRVLYFLEKVGGGTDKQLDLVNEWRSLLIARKKVLKQMWFDLLLAEGPKVILSRTSMVVLHCLRMELKIPLASLFKFVKKNKNAGWVLPRELAMLSETKHAGGDTTNE